MRVISLGVDLEADPVVATVRFSTVIPSSGARSSDIVVTVTQFGPATTVGDLLERAAADLQASVRSAIRVPFDRAPPVGGQRS